MLLSKHATSPSPDVSETLQTRVLQSKGTKAGHKLKQCILYDRLFFDDDPTSCLFIWPYRCVQLTRVHATGLTGTSGQFDSALLSSSQHFGLGQKGHKL